MCNILLESVLEMSFTTTVVAPGLISSSKHCSLLEDGQWQTFLECKTQEMQRSLQPMLITLVITENMHIIARNNVYSRYHECIHSSKLNVWETFPWPRDCVAWGIPQSPYNSLGLHGEVVSDKQPTGNHPQSTLNVGLSKRGQVGPGWNGGEGLCSVGSMVTVAGACGLALI